MKDVEELRNKWKAARKQAESDNNAELSNSYSDRLIGLNTARRIYEKPSNTQMQIDTKTCDSIYHDKRRYELGFDKFCRNCGQSLSD